MQGKITRRGLIGGAAAGTAVTALPDAVAAAPTTAADHASRT